MFMPLDITNKNFNRSFRGYDCEEVNKFIEEVAEDYEKLYKDNIELKDKVTILNEGIQHYKSMEHTLQNTLLIAQKASEDIKNSAYQRSEVIKKEASVDAENVIHEAKKEAARIKQECETIKKEYEMFRMKFKAMLSAELQILDDPLDIKIPDLDDYSISEDNHSFLKIDSDEISTQNILDKDDISATNESLEITSRISTDVTNEERDQLI